MEHKLNCPWTFYYFEKSDEVSYEDSIHKIAKVNTAEEFWHYYSHIKKPDSLSLNLSIHFFRNDSRAMWEDPEYQNGGCFYLTFEKDDKIDFIWERLLLGLIGEQFSDDIIGVFLSQKTQATIICVWHRTSSDAELKIEICKQFQQILELPFHTVIQYKYLFQKLKDQHVSFVLHPNGPRERNR